MDGIKAYGAQHSGLTLDTIEEALAMNLLDVTFKRSEGSPPLPQGEEMLMRSRGAEVLRSQAAVLRVNREARAWRLRKATEPRPRPVQHDQKTTANGTGRGSFKALTEL